MTILSMKYNEVPMGDVAKWPDRFRVLLVAIAGLAFIAGGYPRYLLTEGAPEPEDIDLFFLQDDNVEEVEKILRSMKYQKTSETRAAINYRQIGDPHALSVQLVKPVGQTSMRGRTGNITEVLSTFDFSVNQYAVTSTRSGFVSSVVGEHTLEDQEEMRLRIINLDHPLALVYRLVKYAKKGYYLPRLEAAKLFLSYDKSSDALKHWVKEEVERIEGDYSREEEEGSFELLHALTDGLIGEKELFEIV